MIRVTRGKRREIHNDLEFVRTVLKCPPPRKRLDRRQICPKWMRNQRDELNVGTDEHSTRSRYVRRRHTDSGHVRLFCCLAESHALTRR